MSQRRCIVGLAASILFAATVASMLVVAVFVGIGHLSRNSPAAVDPPADTRRENRPRFGPDESRPIGQTHVGKTREELVAELGAPTREGPWPIGSPPIEVFERYPGLQTLEWQWESGRFLASMYPVDGDWVCFNSYWVPEGWVID